MSTRSTASAAGRVAALLVATLAAGLVAVVLVLTVLVPAVGGGTAYTVLTGSMEPTLPPGTVVVTRETPVADVRVGDVVTYQLESGRPTVATHRVRAVGVTLGGETRLVTQGDANAAADPEPVRPEQLRGVQWYAVPLVGYPAMVVDADLRQVVVLGAVVLLLGYAGHSFAGSAAGALRRRRHTTAGVAA